MIGRLWLLACGQVRVRVTGASLTRFLNLCAAQGITLRQMDRTAWNELHATLSIRDFRTLRRHMGRTGCRVHILRKRGLPFLAARLRPRTALWGGAVFAAALCWLLGTHVWAIQTEIAPAIDETAVMQQLSEMGVRIGMPIKKLNTRQIRWKMMQLQPNITFFSLNLRGQQPDRGRLRQYRPAGGAGRARHYQGGGRAGRRGNAGACARGTANGAGRRRGADRRYAHQRSCRANTRRRKVPHSACARHRAGVHHAYGSGGAATHRAEQAVYG